MSFLVKMRPEQWCCWSLNGHGVPIFPFSSQTPTPSPPLPLSPAFQVRFGLKIADKETNTATKSHGLAARERYERDEGGRASFLRGVI